jgi:hypothetical protein
VICSKRSDHTLTAEGDSLCLPWTEYPTPPPPQSDDLRRLSAWHWATGAHIVLEPLGYEARPPGPNLGNVSAEGHSGPGWGTHTLPGEHEPTNFSDRLPPRHEPSNLRHCRHATGPQISDTAATPRALKSQTLPPRHETSNLRHCRECMSAPAATPRAHKSSGMPGHRLPAPLAEPHSMGLPSLANSGTVRREQACDSEHDQIKSNQSVTR